MRPDAKALWKAAKRHDAPLAKQLILRRSAAAGSLAFVDDFHPRKGTTPLMVACKQRETEHKHPQRSGADTVQLLLEFGADMALQSRDRDANTALHFAAASNQVRAVEFLLHAGADAFALNAHGHAALDTARWHRSRDVVDVLTAQARIYSGWLYVKTVKSADSSIKILTVWKKRWAVALACDSERRVVELALFKDRGDVRPARVVLLQADTHSLVASPKRKWLDRHNMFRVDRPLVVQKTKARRFSRSEQGQRSIEILGDTELLSFAAESPAHREAWISILRRPTHSASFHSLAPTFPSPDVAQWAPVAPSSIVFTESMLSSMTTPSSQHDLLGAVESAPPLSPLGPGLVEVSPAHVSSLDHVFTSPRQREVPSAPTFISEADDFEISTSFYEQRQLSTPSTSVSESAPPSQRSECVICMDAPRDAICVPCGHVAGCFPCLSRQAQAENACPICRSHVQTVVKIYEC